MNAADFHDALRRFGEARTVDEITAMCAERCSELGFDAFIYALRIPTAFSESRLAFLNGYPDGWVDHYMAGAYYEHDPVIAHCSRSLVPVEWRQVTERAPAPARRVMDEATEFGLRAGVSMPIHSPYGELGILSFALDAPDARARETCAHAMPYVQMLAGYLHESVRRVFELNDPVGRPQLTARERECLRWAADGKTSWEIGQLLNMAERTVNFHLNNAMIKLDVCNRQHAVAKAVMNGAIAPHPF
jgi:DNA-binding CsgD family transcriptional regulator